MVISINGKQISLDEVKVWENKRKDAVIKKMVRMFGVSDRNYSPDELASMKRKIPEDKMREALKSGIRLTTFGTRFLLAIGHGKHTSSVTEIDLPGIRAEQVSKGYFDVMLNNTEDNLLLGLRANPDHYLLQGVGDDGQEVIECTGAMPFPSHFIIYYGREDGLTSMQNSSYPYQAAGIACLPDGKIIGGVRHQMKDTNEGTHIRLEVEFPQHMPKKVLAQHQLHLACEFMNWLGEIMRRNGYEG